ncbi:uncharacterized protein PRCAT00000633001 [Priceomyces carsonii]|uniref:uncharacterized protein n=1 Tax=Priceomyces carsonii TaxID=28549 RepID=UPI002ED83173|nr:unnamed protein product [Priceomyces carsonii]
MSDRQQQITTTNQRSPVALNIANYLRDNKSLKHRTGLLNNADDVDFFRFKRLERALLSDDYKKKQQNPKNGLVPLTSQPEVAKLFILLIQNQLVIPVEKLHYADVKKVKGWKPNKLKPTLKPVQKANLDPDAYYVWTYAKPNPYIFLYSILTIAGVFTVILFPLWPSFMKIGVWYLSMGALCVLGLFFVLAIIRLIIYVISLFAFPKPFWLFPNLFEDCGVIESFQPLYGWEEPKKLKKSKKSQSEKSLEETNNSTSSDSKGTPESEASGALKNDTSVNRRKVVLEEVDE